MVFLNQTHDDTAPSLPQHDALVVAHLAPASYAAPLPRAVQNPFGSIWHYIESLLTDQSVDAVRFPLQCHM